ARVISTLSLHDALPISWMSREPDYDAEKETRRIQARLDAAKVPPDVRLAAAKPVKSKVRWCTRCVYPSISAAPMEFDEHGVCMRSEEHTSELQSLTNLV